MKVLSLLLLAILWWSTPVAAQAVQMCLCTGAAGCKIASGSWPNDGNVPTSCNFYRSGTKVATGTMVLASTVPITNASVCTPADPAYVPGPAGNMACVGTLPTQAAGTTVALTVRGVNAAGEAPDGTVLTFQSVSALPVVPAATGVRVTP